MEIKNFKSTGLNACKIGVKDPNLSEKIYYTPKPVYESRKI
jgi:hypothetical protein